MTHYKKNYTTVNLESLDAMKQSGIEISENISLSHSSSTALQRLLDAQTSGQAERHFKAVVSQYYSNLAYDWLDKNGVACLPSEFDEWMDMGLAAKAHILKLAGIQVNLHNGFFTTDTWLR